MKKVLVGCLIFAVIAAVAGGIITYNFVVKPLMVVGSGVVELGKTVQQFQELEANVQNRASFDPPENAQLEAAQFQRLLSVQRQMRSHLEGRLSELEARYKALSREFESSGKEPSITDMMQAYQDLGALILDAKRAQVDALNRHGFSLEEYQWVRNQTYMALGYSLAGAAVYQQDYLGEQATRVPAENAALVSEHAEELGENMAFIWFGL